jgi:hypothetical protein
LAAVGATGAVTLVVAGSAPTAVALPPGQILAITYHDKTGTGVAFDIVSTAVDATAKATIYIPAGYGIDLSRPPQTTIGRAFVIFGGSGSAYVGWGAIKVGDPADPAAQACAPGSHAAVWLASYKGEGQAVTVRFSVDPTSGAETALGAFRLVACFPSPYTTKVLPLLHLELALSGPGGPVVTPPANGTYLWRMFVTPYVVGTATPNTAATFEARTRVLAPHVLTAHVRYRAKGQKLFVSGRLRHWASLGAVSCCGSSGGRRTASYGSSAASAQGRRGATPWSRACARCGCRGRSRSWCSVTSRPHRVSSPAPRRPDASTRASRHPLRRPSR